MDARLCRESILSPSLNIRAAVFAALCALTIVPIGVMARPHPTPTPSPTPTPPPEDPAITSVATREFVAWQAGVVNLSHYATASQSLITATKITQTAAALGQAGSLERNGVEWVGPLHIDDAPPGVRGYIYRMHCSQKAVYEELMMEQDGKIAGILFRDTLTDESPTPAPTPTPFATPD